MTTLIMQTRQAKDSDFPFYVDNLFIIFSLTPSFQKIFFLRLSLISLLMYLDENFMKL